MILYDTESVLTGSRWVTGRRADIPYGVKFEPELIARSFYLGISSWRDVNAHNYVCLYVPGGLINGDFSAPDDYNVLIQPKTLRANDAAFWAGTWYWTWRGGVGPGKRSSSAQVSSTVITGGGVLTRKAKGHTKREGFN